MDSLVPDAISDHSALAAQRVKGIGRLSCVRKDEITGISRLYQEGAAKIRLPKTADRAFQAVLINTAGGLTGGDRVDWEVDVEEDAAATVTTQACEKVYRSMGDEARVAVRLSVGRGGHLSWLPQETIMFDRAQLSRTIDLDMEADSQALLLESVVFGRLAMGERTANGLFRDRWNVRQQGRLVHAEAFSIGPDIGALLKGRAVANGAAAIANILFVSPEAEQKLDAVRAIIGEGGGASFWKVAGTGKLLARLIDEDSYNLRKRLVPLVELLNGQAGLPKVWSL
ncbi:urease accessory protein UreD [Mesorhizobium sp. SB112]|uniref:urease accessory protein UreD n=1 Tax=Mesorhizobium sp. SB112 TaxID=3151853 RepID=UPI0032643C18